MKRMTLVIECEEFPSFAFNTPVLGSKLVTASVGDAFEEIERLARRVDELTDAREYQDEKIDEVRDLLDKLRD